MESWEKLGAGGVWEMGEGRARGGRLKGSEVRELCSNAQFFCNENKEQGGSQKQINNEQELGMRGIGGREVWTPCFPPSPPPTPHLPFPC